MLIPVDPIYHCTPPEELTFNSNCTKQQILDYSIPKQAKNGKNKYSRCELYARNYTRTTDRDICAESQINSSSSSPSPETFACENWDYSSDLYESTIVTEWNLVCERTAMAKHTSGFFMATRGVGTLICGLLADR